MRYDAKLLKKILANIQDHIKKITGHDLIEYIISKYPRKKRPMFTFRDG